MSCTCRCDSEMETADRNYALLHYIKSKMVGAMYTCACTIVCVHRTIPARAHWMIPSSYTPGSVIIYIKLSTRFSNISSYTPAGVVYDCMWPLPPLRYHWYKDTLHIVGTALLDTSTIGQCLWLQKYLE